MLKTAPKHVGPMLKCCYMRIVFVGGGSGGHFYPLMATAEALREQQPTAELFYIGPNAFNAEELANSFKKLSMLDPKPNPFTALRSDT